MSALQTRGEPREFDAFLRPVARTVQLGFGLVGTLVLLWFQAWVWLPVPLAGSFLLYEAFFYSRADKPLRIAIDEQALVVEDRFLQARSRFDLTGLHSATLVYRRHDEERVDAVLLLCDRSQVRLGLQLRLPAERFEPRPDDVDLDLCNLVLGSISGVIRALAPRERMLRQVIPDPAALAWFREELPPEVWRRSTVRFWRGGAPELDLFGYHAGEHDGLIHLDGREVLFTDAENSSRLEPAAPTGAERKAILFRMDGEEHSETPERLPLWLQPVGSRTVAIPAPMSDGALPESSLRDDLLHVHPPEGAILLWRLWREIPRDQWPEAWSEALDAARANLDHWPDGIPLPP